MSIFDHLTLEEQFRDLKDRMNRFDRKFATVGERLLNLEHPATEGARELLIEIAQLIRRVLEQANNKETLDEILVTLREVQDKGVETMGLADDILKAQADEKVVVQELVTAVSNVASDTSGLVKKIEELIAAGSPATIEQLEAILKAAQENSDAVKAVRDSAKALDDSVPVPPVVVTP